jgi:hypothetical protein
MISMRTPLTVATAALLGGTPPLIAQAPTAVQHPIFAGTWAPSDPDRSEKLFSVGLTSIPGGGRLTIEQTADRLTVTTRHPQFAGSPTSIQGNHSDILARW